MGEMLQLRLLGRPEIIRAGVSVTESLSSKGQAILYYLAVTSRPQPRSSLASLLWGDMPDAAARTNLRKALANLREMVGDYLDLDRQMVTFNLDRPYWVDVTDFMANVGPSSPPLDVERLQKAVDLYRGDFLTGYYVRNALDFETWMLAEQARLRELVIQALQTLAAHYAERDELAKGIGYIRRLLNLEPWREEAHRQLMLLLARNGQRSIALAQYEICRQVLNEELGVAPGLETVELYKHIRDGKIIRQSDDSSWLPTHPEPHPEPLDPNLPTKLDLAMNWAVRHLKSTTRYSFLCKAPTGLEATSPWQQSRLTWCGFASWLKGCRSPWNWRLAGCGRFPALRLRRRLSAAWTF
jgi:DNA-binding SARP family transcriptional activator